MDILTNINWEDVAKRAAWTFAQAFLAVFLIGADSIIDLLFKGDWQQLYVLSLATVVAGIAAGLSAVKSVALEIIATLKES